MDDRHGVLGQGGDQVGMHSQAKRSGSDENGLERSASLLNDDHHQPDRIFNVRSFCYPPSCSLQSTLCAARLYRIYGYLWRRFVACQLSFRLLFKAECLSL